MAPSAVLPTVPTAFIQVWNESNSSDTTEQSLPRPSQRLTCALPPPQVWCEPPASSPSSAPSCCCSAESASPPAASTKARGTSSWEEGSCLWLQVGLERWCGFEGELPFRRMRLCFFSSSKERHYSQLSMRFLLLLYLITLNATLIRSSYVGYADWLCNYTHLFSL